MPLQHVGYEEVYCAPTNMPGRNKSFMFFPLIFIDALVTHSIDSVDESLKPQPMSIFSDNVRHCT